MFDFLNNWPHCAFKHSVSKALLILVVAMGLILDGLKKQYE